jgi:membrane-bound hydrogenase subunit alpha
MVHKIRAPSDLNVATYKKSCVGQTIADATIILAAVDPCYCCTERMAFAYDYYSRRKIMNGIDLIRLSHEKTNNIKMSI